MPIFPLNCIDMNALSSKSPHFLLSYLQSSAKVAIKEYERHVWLEEQADDCLNHSLNVLA